MQRADPVEDDSRAASAEEGLGRLKVPTRPDADCSADEGEPLVTVREDDEDVGDEVGARDTAAAAVPPRAARTEPENEEPGVREVHAMGRSPTTGD